ncbi:iron chelate uptake ABC transporter family permease subunit, partial [Staphylococcus warneri]|uniref:iron chelate uptake ABC transporter family permease subunit n=1 Tax=Staphylococcus warneri TaxID=1292 RepID=UPI0030BFD44A
EEDMKKHPAFLMVIMLALLIVTTYVAVVVGKIPISFDQVMTKVTTGSEQHVDAVIDLRFPRIFIALFVGAILAVSGALLQA